MLARRTAGQLFLLSSGMTHDSGFGMNRGSCLCGDIAWSVDGEFMMLVNCHCSICRKVHGSAYGAFVASPAEGFHWIAGEDKMSSYRSSTEGVRAFCPRCGSNVAAVMGNLAVMPAGNFEGDINRSLDSHIFVAHKACWFDVPNDAPQFDEFSPDYSGVAVDTATRVPATDGAVGGSCSCGRVSYEFDGPAERMDHCHCPQCRKSRSAPFSTQAIVARDRFRWLRGEDDIAQYTDTDASHFSVSFCRVCSSPLPVNEESSDTVVLPAGSIDQDPGVRPQAHFHVSSKAPWVEITDDLPQYDELPPR
jgi:hypothetical protein